MGVDGTTCKGMVGIDTYVDDIHVTVLSQSCFLMHSCQMTDCTDDFN